MSDPGTRATQAAENRLAREFEKVYRQAAVEMKAKLKEFTDEYGEKLAEKQQQVAEGKLTQSELKSWMDHQGQMMDLMEQKIDQCTGVMLNANKKAMAMVNGESLGVFAENANWQSYQLTQDTGMALSFSIYDESTVENLIKNKPELLPRKVVNGKKDKAWNKSKISNAVTQAIIQGESIPKMAGRLAAETGETNANAMIRYARTAMTGAQNAGRVEMLKKAQGMGIKVKKKWLATLDSRTRDSHQEMDGETAEVDEDFVTPLGSKMKYPGDISGKPGDVWNCRCTLIYEYEGFPEDAANDARRDNESGEEIQNMTYTEWKEWQKQNIQESELEKGINRAVKNSSVDGKDLMGVWKRRPDQFDFEIEDIMNAQGYDGLPSIYNGDDFENAVRESSFIAQRTYSAPDMETLKLYRDQLYNGKWYVDCSTGGAQYGQGMYCAADYNGKLTAGIREEMEHYKDLNQFRGSPYAYVETLTVTKDAKFIKYNDVLPTYYNKLADAEKVAEKAKQYGLSAKWESAYKDALQARLDFISAKKDKSVRYSRQELDKLAKTANRKEEKALDMAMQAGLKGKELSEAVYIPKYDVDIGSMAAQMGYDAINAEGHGASGSYTVILNRTKCIFKGD